ncbi:MAG: tetratricopeptide repeat protein, partial [Candidatus Caldarchaeum sp.]
MRTEKKKPLKDKEKHATGRTKGLKPPFSDYGRKVALLEEAITQMNEGRYSKAAITLKELLTLDPHNMEARRLFATLHLRLGNLLSAKQAFDSLIEEAFARQDYWLAESLLREYLSAGPRCVPYLEKLGMLYLEKGQVMEAVTEYAKAIEFLIEDPDPDDPEHASRLYRHIKDLAPASPAVIRLNRYFDPHTGALLANSLNDPTEPFIELSEEEDQASPSDFPGSIEPVESGLESESTLGVAAGGTEWSHEPSPLASTLEPLSVLEVERQDGTESLDEREDCPQRESAAFVDGEPIARDVTIEQTAQWSLAASCSEEDELPAGSPADGASLIEGEPNEVINGHSTVAHEHLSVLATDETAFVSTEEDRPIDAQMASSTLGLGEGGPRSAVVDEVSGNPEVGLITEQSLEPSEFLQQVAEVSEASVDSLTILEKTAEQQTEGRNAADQQGGKGEETSSSSTGIDGLERTTEPYEADGSETLLATEPIALSGDQPVESVDEVLVLVNEAREAEMPPACSVVSPVDSPFVATDPAGHSRKSDPPPDERISVLPIEEAVSEDHVMPSTGDLSLVADEREEEQSVATGLDQPEESADSIATGLEVGQLAESSWAYGQEAGYESDSSREVLFPFTPSPLNVEERNQKGEADEAGEEGAGAQERGEQDQQAKDHTESFGDSCATPLETSQVGREEWGIDLAEEQGAEAAIANELATWYEGEPQKEELAAAVGPNDADRSVRMDEQVLETQEEGQYEVRADDPGSGLLREQLTEPELLDRGVTEEAVSLVGEDEPAPGDGQGQVCVASPLEAALSVSGPEDLDTGQDRSQASDTAKAWSPQEAVQPSEAVQSGVWRQDQEVGAARSTVAAAVEVLFNKTASQAASLGLEHERREHDKATKRLRRKKLGGVDRIAGIFAEGVAWSLSTTSLVALASVGLL